jgi:NAD(P)-dependent dehydrogenase (short-subunit alcohol dehydrogenase family)
LIRAKMTAGAQSKVAVQSSVSSAGFRAAWEPGENCEPWPNRLWRRRVEQCNRRRGAEHREETLSSLFDLTGRVAIVTGSSRGIGRAIAERLAEHGATVIVSSRKADACAETAAAINRACGREAAKPIAANISSKDDLRRLVDETNDAFGRIDILVCNAASNPYYGPMAGISDEQFRKILENNVLADHWLIQMAARGMLERNDGSIVIISSIGGLKGSPVIGAYNISKAADLQLARNLAVEWGKHNVRVNCIAPGLIRTDFARALWENPQTLKAATSRTPLGRIGEADEIAGAAVYLVSKAGSFMTGQTIVIDGGATIAG